MPPQRRDPRSVLRGRGEGQPASVAPGQTARIQMVQAWIPDEGERVITCNGPSDYERGRYAVLRYER